MYKKAEMQPYLKAEAKPSLQNRALFESIKEAVLEAGLPENILIQLEARSDVGELLGCSEYVDLLIPRGFKFICKVYYGQYKYSCYGAC